MEIQSPLLMDFTLGGLSELLTAKGKRPYLARQVFDWYYQKWQSSPHLWSNVSKEDRAFMAEQFSLEPPHILWAKASADGTKKFLLQMADGKSVEAVVIASERRLTLCLSTQVGCAMGCVFCHTGTQGLSRNLRVGEIVGQFVAVQKWLHAQQQAPSRLSHVVFMGMGEPLHNFEAVKRAVELLMEPAGIGMGQRRITLSTSGLVPQILKLTQPGEFPPINIAISLHAACDDIRSRLMPINRRYDLTRLFAAIKAIPLKAHRHITYEYLLIDGVNNRLQDVEALAGLIPPRASKINLIPFNQYPGGQFKRPADSNIKWFQRELTQRGLTCTVRQTKGDDILAACGQLKTLMTKGGDESAQPL